MTETLWLIVTFCRNVEEARDEIENADESNLLLWDTKKNLESINAALDKMAPDAAQLFKERILSGAAFKGVCYGDELDLSAEEKAACDSFIENYRP